MGIRVLASPEAGSRTNGGDDGALTSTGHEDERHRQRLLLPREDSGVLIIYPTDSASGEMARVYDEEHPEGQDIDCEAVRAIGVCVGVRAPKDASRLFVDLPNATFANLSPLDTSLRLIDLSGWDTSCVRGMTGMFSGCTSFAFLNLSNWDAFRAAVMEGMLHGRFSFISLGPLG